MENLDRFSALFFLRITKHVQGDAVVDVLLGTDAVDRLLHFAVAAVAPLHGVGGRGKQFVIEECQGLVKVGRAKPAQDFADLFEAADTLAQLGQFRQRSIGAAPTIKQAVDLFHEVPQCSQLRQTTCDTLQQPMFRRGQIVRDKKVTMLEEIPDFLFQPLTLADDALGRKRGGATALGRRPG